MSSKTNCNPPKQEWFGSFNKPRDSNDDTPEYDVLVVLNNNVPVLGIIRSQDDGIVFHDHALADYFFFINDRTDFSVVVFLGAINDENLSLINSWLHRISRGPEEESVEAVFDEEGIQTLVIFDFIFTDSKKSAGEFG